MDSQEASANSTSANPSLGDVQAPTSTPPQIHFDHRAQMFTAMWEKTKEIWRVDKPAARERCLELIQYAYLPRAIRCMAYHMLVCYSPASDVEYWLDLALELIEEMESITIDEATVALRERNDLIRVHVQQAEQKLRETKVQQEDNGSKATEQQTQAASAVGQQAPVSMLSKLAMRPVGATYMTPPPTSPEPSASGQEENGNGSESNENGNNTPAQDEGEKRNAMG